MVRYQGDDPISLINRRSTAGLCVIGIIGILMIAISGPVFYPTDSNKLEKHVYFKIASWDFPDEYGQGIEYFKLYENSTGSWLLEETVWYYNVSEFHEWDEGVGIKIRCVTLFNETLTGSADPTEGKNYQRHSILVTSGGLPIFDQQNFTYAYHDDGIYPDLWLYAYDVVLGFLPENGMFYTTTILYEIFYSL